MNQYIYYHLNVQIYIMILIVANITCDLEEYFDEKTDPMQIILNGMIMIIITIMMNLAAKCLTPNV